MSLILKGIDLPKEGEILGLRIRADRTAFSILRDAKTEVVLKLNDTEAIQIPTPHGRLIDADVIKNELGVSDEDIYVSEILTDAPTIIEAEE